MNTPLRRVGLAMMVMIVLLLANATYIQVVKADDYRANPRNQRILLDEYARERGQIVSQFGGEILASGKRTNDRLQYLRTYRDGEVFAPVTGFYSWRYGARGLEQVENEFLSGSDPRLFVRRLADMVTGRDPSGGHVQVTVSPKVQRAAYNGLASRGYTGAVVAMNPRTGEILAMASTPSFDPNKLASHSGKVQQDAWTKWNCDKSKAGCDHNNPMLNRAVHDTYPPGSTFKLVVTAAALENGMKPGDKVETAPRVTLPGTNVTLENYDGGACPGGTLELALAYSCNTAFAKIAADLGADKLRETASRFGIGMDGLEIPLAVARSGLGDIDSEDKLYQSGIGQRDVRLTPMQVALMSATVANAGITMKPQLVKELMAPDLTTLQEFDAEELTGERVMTERNAGLLRDMMIDSESKSASCNAGAPPIPGVTIASKTGTAQHGTGDDDHTWYTAFAPADDPQVAVAVFVERGGGVVKPTGSKVSCPIGRQVIAAALEEG